MSDPVLAAAKPILKWVGGKRKLVPMLLQMIPEFGEYHEPFVGGGALFFGLAEADVTERWANLSDQNERLIRSYRAIRDDLETVLSRLETMAKGHCKELYYEIRDQEIDQAQTDAEVAAWFIYLNRTGFNGLYRVNRSGRFIPSPKGSTKTRGCCCSIQRSALPQAIRVQWILDCCPAPIPITCPSAARQTEFDCV